MSHARTRDVALYGAEVSTCDTHPISTFPEMLRAYRASAGTSQARLARRIGLDHSTVSRWESGDRHPERENVLAIADALGLLPGDATRLMESAGYTDGLEPDVATFRAYPAEVRAMLVRIGDMMTRPGAA